MRTSKNFFDKDTAYKMMRKDMIHKYGKDKTKTIFDKASEELELLYNEYHNIPEGERRHTHESIFPRIALYRVLLEELPDKAMSIMDLAVENAGIKVGKILNVLTSIPGMKSIFIKIFKYMTKEMFGPSAGFQQQFYETKKDELRFDIIECPYCKYCRLCGCDDLTHTFCDSDIYCYGHLSGIDFKRTQTLGTGGDCCDFNLKVRRK